MVCRQPFLWLKLSSPGISSASSIVSDVMSKVAGASDLLIAVRLGFFRPCGPRIRSRVGLTSASICSMGEKSTVTSGLGTSSSVFCFVQKKGNFCHHLDTEISKRGIEEEMNGAGADDDDVVVACV